LGNSNGLKYRPETENAYVLCPRSKAVLSPQQRVVERAHRALALRCLSVDDLEVRTILEKYDFRAARHLESYEYGELAGDGMWLDEQLARLVADRRARVVKFRDEKAFRTAAARTRWVVQKADGVFDERLLVRLLEFVLGDPTRVESIDDDSVTLTFAVCVECDRRYWPRPIRCQADGGDVELRGVAFTRETVRDSLILPTMTKEQAARAVSGL
jgi:hypothetical protein